MYSLLGGISIGAVTGWSAGMSSHSGRSALVLLAVMVGATLVVHLLAGEGAAAALVFAFFGSFAARRLLGRSLASARTWDEEVL